MPFAADIPPQLEERVICSIVAAAKYDLPANIILAVAAQEGGKPGQWVKNTNGTYDVGPLQFNTSYLATLKRYGISSQDVEKSGCYPYELAAWRIRGHILNDSGDLWTRVANYHSRTPVHNQTYRKLVMKRALTWANWLDQHFQTHDVDQAGVMDKKNSGRTATVVIEAKSGYTPEKVVAQKQPETEPKPVAKSDYKPTAYVSRGIAIAE